MGTAANQPIGSGSTIGNLVVERELGRGAFGVVYLARDQILDRRVALKTIVPTGFELPPEAIESFLDEARAIARLNSPNVVTLYQIHERPPGHWMLEMEFVEGTTLRELVDSPNGTSMDSIRRILRGITVGLKAAHDSGVLHRDIKPANVLVAGDGTAKLTDFGLAQVVTDESMRFDDGDNLVGTPSYMAPEILQGASATGASDLWSLGVMAYQLLAGRMPFDSKNLATFFFEVQNSPPPALAPIIEPQLRQFVVRCLEKDPAERASSCVELLEILDGAAEVPAERVAERPVVVRRERMFGRRKELAHLESVLDRVRGGASTGVVVVGDGGIGKSTLLDEMQTAAAGQGFVWLSATLSRFEGPLQTLVEAVQSSARTERSWRTAAFGPASGIVAKMLRGESVPELESPEQAVWALEHLFRGVATERPLCLCVEEARHAQEDDVSLLADLIRRLTDSRFVIVLTARPEASILSRLALLPNLERITLEGLSREALYALLEHTFGPVTIPAKLAGRICARSDGNPLVASEMLRHLEEQGAVTRVGNRMEASAGWDSDSVPRRLHDLVAARLDNLDEDDRALLEVAAVDGRQFDGQALAAVSELPLIQVLRRLQKLCRTKSLIVPSDDGYRFANSFLQQVLYEDMAPELQRELHRALAAHLEQREGDRDAERMVRHWEGCGEPGKARPYLLEAAAGAARRQEHGRLVDFCERAGLLEESLGPDTAVDNAALVISLSRALVRTGRGEEQSRLLANLRNGAGLREDRELELRVELRQADAMRAAGAAPEIDVARVRELAEHFGDSQSGGEAHQLLGMLAKLDGELETAQREFQRAREIFEALGAEAGESDALNQLGSVAMRSGRNEEAERLYSEAAELATRIGREMSAALSWVNRATSAMGHGRLEGHAPVLERAIRTLELTGNPHLAAHARCTLADLRYALGDVSGAKEALDQAVPALRETKHILALALALRLQANLLAVAGELVEAESKLREALELTERAQDYGQRATAWAAIAQLRCLAGDAEQAAAAARQSLDLVKTTPHGVDDLMLLIGEAGAYGLPCDVCAEALAAVPIEEQESLHAAVLAAACAFADKQSDPAPLAAGAAALRSEPVGFRRAVLQVIADWFEVEALQREGNDAGAKELARAGLAAAASLNHVWLKSGFERVLARASTD